MILLFGGSEKLFKFGFHSSWNIIFISSLFAKIFSETSTDEINSLKILKSLVELFGNWIPASDAIPPNPEREMLCSASPTGFSLYSTVYFFSAYWRYNDPKKIKKIQVI